MKSLRCYTSMPAVAASAFLMVAAAVLACVVSIVPAWADNGICGYAYLEPNADNPETYTLCIEKGLRSEGVYQELGAVPTASANGQDLPWVSPIDQRDKVTAIKVTTSPEGKVRPQSVAWWFSDFYSVASIDLSGLDTADATSMQGMFWNCWSLTTLDPSPLDTAHVTNMNGMFYYCRWLTSLDLSGFNTASVTDMSSMFMDCSNLASIDLTGFNTANVTDMRYLFSGCRSLAQLDLSSFDATQAIYLSSMFDGCASLASVEFGQFNTSNATSMNSMFQGCSSLSALDLSRFDTSSVTDMAFMFRSCSSLSELDLSAFNTSSVTDMSGLFQNCSSLEALDLSHFDTSRVTSMPSLFRGCSSLASLDLSVLDVSNVDFLAWSFQDCSSLESVNLSGLDFSKVTDASSMFDGCRMLSVVNLEGVTYPASNPSILMDALVVCDVREIVMGPHLPDASACESLFSIASTWVLKDDETQAFTSAHMLSDYLASAGSAATLEVGSEYLGVFAYGEEQDGVLVLCPEVKALEEGQTAFGFARGTFVPWKDSAFSFGRVRIEPGVAPQSMEGWFEGCSNLVRVEGLQNIDASQATTMRSMFSGCSSLIELDLSSLDMSHVADASYLCENCSALASVKLPRLASSNLVWIDGMFNNCTSLVDVDLSTFDVSKVTNMYGVFANCKSLERLDLSHFDTSSATDMAFMFSGCESLSSLDLSGFSTDHATSLNYLFNECRSLTNLDLSSFRITMFTGVSGLFFGCESLSSLSLPKQSGFHDSYSNFLAGCENLETIQTQEESSIVPRFPRGMWAADGSGAEYRHDAIPENVAVTYRKVSNEPYWYALLSSDGALSLGTQPVSAAQGEELYRLYDDSALNAQGAPWLERAADITSVNVAPGVAPTSTAHWFEDCTALSSLDLSHLDTSNTSDFSCMFYGCSSLRELDLSNMSTRNATAMKRMFHGCRSLESVTFGPDFAFRGATWSRLAGSELPVGVWQAEGAAPDDEGRLHAYASDSIPSLTPGTYHRVDDSAEGLVVESLRGDTADNAQSYTVETELVADGAGGYEAVETYVLGDEFSSGELVVGESSGASALKMVNPSKGAVTAQTLKAIKGDKSVTTIIIGPKVTKIKAEAFAGCPYVKVVRVRSSKLNKASKVARCLTKSNVTEVVIDKRYVKSSDAKHVKAAFKKAARPSKRSCTIRYSSEAR